MEIHERYAIEEFGKRVQWCIHYLNQKDGIRPISNYADLYNAIFEIERVPRAGLKSKPQFDRYKSGLKTVPYIILNAVKTIYPRIPWEALTIQSIEEFFEIVTEEQRRYDPWMEAAERVARDRLSLSRAAKLYYADVDAAPSDFPLVAGEGWLLQEPLRLTEADESPAWNALIPDVEGSALWEGGVEYLDIKRKIVKSTITNGETYRLLAFSMRDAVPSFTFGRGRYFNYINTLEVLAAEFAMKPHHLAPASHPRRGAPKDIFELGGRSAFPGVNALLIVKNFHGHTGMTPIDRFALHRRGVATAEAQNTIHVVPAGGHQPLGPTHENEEELLIWRTVVREFIEELFNKEQAARLRHSSVDFFDQPAVRYYLSSIFRREGAAAVYYLGMGFDPLTTKPEILVAIVIDWRVISANDDTLNSKIFSKIVDENYEGEVFFVPLSRDRMIEEATRQRNESSILPAAKACLLQASRREAYQRIVGMS